MMLAQYLILMIRIPYMLGNNNNSTIKPHNSSPLNPHSQQLVLLMNKRTLWPRKIRIRNRNRDPDGSSQTADCPSSEGSCLLTTIPGQLTFTLSVSLGFTYFWRGRCTKSKPWHVVAIIQLHIMTVFGIHPRPHPATHLTYFPSSSCVQMENNVPQFFICTSHKIGGAKIATIKDSKIKLESIIDSFMDLSCLWRYILKEIRWICHACHRNLNFLFSIFSHLNFTFKINCQWVFENHTRLILQAAKLS